MRARRAVVCIDTRLPLPAVRSVPGPLFSRGFLPHPDRHRYLCRVWQVFNEVKRNQVPEAGEENLFCLDGWIMMGPAKKAWQPVLTAHLVGVPVTLFCVFECVFATLPSASPPAGPLPPHASSSLTPS